MVTVQQFAEMEKECKQLGFDLDCRTDGPLGIGQLWATKFTIKKNGVVVVETDDRVNVKLFASLISVIQNCPAN